MIKITYSESSIKASGHANFDLKGKDIVCAGVSAIIMGAINWFKEEDIVLSIDGDNKIELKLINKSKKNKQLIELVLIQLKSIELKYSKNIKLEMEN